MQGQSKECADTCLCPMGKTILTAHSYARPCNEHVCVHTNEHKRTSKHMDNKCVQVHKHTEHVWHTRARTHRASRHKRGYPLTFKEAGSTPCLARQPDHILALTPHSSPHPPRLAEVIPVIAGLCPQKKTRGLSRDPGDQWDILGSDSTASLTHHTTDSSLQNTLYKGGEVTQLTD